LDKLCSRPRSYKGARVKNIIVSQGPVAKEEIKAGLEITLPFSCSRNSTADVSGSVLIDKGLVELTSLSA
jgi:hypothetical protein